MMAEGVGREALKTKVARHRLVRKVAGSGSNPAPATKLKPRNSGALRQAHPPQDVLESWVRSKRIGDRFEHEMDE